MYFVKAPSILKKLYPQELIWKRDSEDSIYLTFDDGPHPFATPYVLDELEKYQAKATFFCIGNNVVAHPEIYQRICTSGHKVGNHTFSHPNGWKTKSSKYVSNVKEASELIDSSIFRPPYGRIRKKQIKAIFQLGYKIVMWDVLCGDFDATISPEQCWRNIEENIEPGSIIVFHDSTKAWERMKYALPLTLDFCRQKGWKMETL